MVTEIEKCKIDKNCPNEQVHTEFRKRTETRLEKLEVFKEDTAIALERIRGSIEKVELNTAQITIDNSKANLEITKKIDEIAKNSAYSNEKMLHGINSYDKRVKSLEDKEDKRLAGTTRKIISYIGIAILGAVISGIISWVAWFINKVMA